MMIKTLVGASLMVGAVSLAPQALAETESPVTCFEAKKITSLQSRFDKLDADRQDTLQANVEMTFHTGEDYVLPARFYAKQDTGETDFAITDDGKVVNMAGLLSLPPETELCILGAPDEDDKKGGMSAGVDIAFQNKSGQHTMDEITDGLKDGKTYYKKMVGPPMSLMIPKMTHIMIDYEDAEIVPDVTAWTDGVQVDNITLETFGDTYLIEVSELQEREVSDIMISGGAYTLRPVPDAKTLKKFGFSD